MRPIDGESFLAGVSLTLAVVLGVGTAQPGGLNPAPGRFWLETADNGRAYLVDTITGQVWSVGNPDFNGPKVGGAGQ